MGNDVFCTIISGTKHEDFIYRDERVAVIRDIKPAAPVHLLVMPIEHFDSIGEFSQEHEELVGHMVRVAHQVAHKEGLENGYRLVVNEGKDGGKMVPHFHIHVLGGGPLGHKLGTE
jgi:histidine triad (HIT) family protein